MASLTHHSEALFHGCRAILLPMFSGIMITRGILGQTSAHQQPHVYLNAKNDARLNFSLSSLGMFGV